MAEPEERVEPESSGQARGEVAPELESLRRERDDFLARWQRAAADYQNLKRRSAHEVEGAVRRSLEQLLAGLLLVLDHLELALSAPVESEDAKALAQGVRLTREQLLNVLRKEGVEPVRPDGGPFDPSLHEAVATVERDDLEPGSVVEVVRPGYTWRGQVLRSAHVRVARAPASSGSPPAGQARNP